MGLILSEFFVVLQGPFSTAPFFRVSGVLGFLERLGCSFVGVMVCGFQVPSQELNNRMKLRV